jgi:hypothetical protein
MDLTLREGYWIKFCMKLIDHCSQFDCPFCDLVLIRQYFLIPDRINEFMELRQ